MRSERYTGPLVSSLLKRNLPDKSTLDSSLEDDVKEVVLPSGGRVILGKPGALLADVLLDIVNREASLVSVLNMFDDGQFSSGFANKINLLTLKALLREGERLEDAIAKSLKEPLTSESKRTIPPESTIVVTDAVRTSPVDVSIIEDVLTDKDRTSGQDEDGDPALVIVDNADDDPIAIESVEDQKVIKVAVDESDVDDPLLNGVTSVSINDENILDVSGGFFSGLGNIIKKGAASVLRGAASAIPGGALVYDAASEIINPSREAKEQAYPTRPELENEIIPISMSQPRQYVPMNDAIPYRDMLSYPMVHSGPTQGCKRLMRTRPWEGGPAVLPGSRMTEEMAKEIVSKRIAKLNAGAIDASSRLPFIVPLDDSVDLVSSPVRDTADFSLLHAVMANSIIRQSTRAFRTQVKSGTFSGSTLSLVADESLTGSNASYEVPFFIVSFGLSELHGVRGGLIKFSMTIPQGLAVDGPLESRYALNEGYRLLKTGDIIVKLSVLDPQARTGRLLLFPWTSAQAVVGYQPCYVRSNHDPDDEETGVDEITLSVSSAPDQTYVTLEIPGVEDPFMNEIIDSVYTGLM